MYPPSSRGTGNRVPQAPRAEDHQSDCDNQVHTHQFHHTNQHQQPSNNHPHHNHSGRTLPWPALDGNRIAIPRAVAPDRVKRDEDRCNDGHNNDPASYPRRIETHHRHHRDDPTKFRQSPPVGEKNNIESNRRPVVGSRVPNLSGLRAPLMGVDDFNLTASNIDLSQEAAVAPCVTPDIVEVPSNCEGMVTNDKGIVGDVFYGLVNKVYGVLVPDTTTRPGQRRSSNCRHYHAEKTTGTTNRPVRVPPQAPNGPQAPNRPQPPNGPQPPNRPQPPNGPQAPSGPPQLTVTHYPPNRQETKKCDGLRPCRRDNYNYNNNALSPQPGFNYVRKPPAREYNNGEERIPSDLTPEEIKSKIKYIQNLLPSIPVKNIMQALKENDFHLKRTLETLVDQLTYKAAMLEQSKLMVAGSMLFLNQSQMNSPGYDENDENLPIGSFMYHHKYNNVQPIEPPRKYQDRPPPIMNGPYAGLTPALFVSNSPFQLAKPTGRKRALLIGINYFGQSKELNGCVDDVMRMKNLISSVYGFLDDPTCMTVLTDKADSDPRLKPTRKNVLSAMRWLVDGSKAGDVLFFQFSGHGGQKKDLSGTEIDGFDETIMPVDYKRAGHITDDEIHNTMIRDLKSGVKLICVMDCCHSGSGMDLPFYWEPEKRRWEEETFPKYSEGDVQLISSCQDSQTAADLMIPSWGSGGAVTLALVTALSQNPFDLTIAELLDHLRRFLAEKRFTQCPQLSSTQSFDISKATFMLDIVHNTNQYIGQKIPQPCLQGKYDTRLKPSPNLINRLDPRLFR